MAGCSVNGARWALGSDREGRGMWPEGMVVKAVEILIKGGGTAGKDSVFRVEPGSTARQVQGKMERCPRKRWKTLKSLLTTEPLRGDGGKVWEGGEKCEFGSRGRKHKVSTWRR